MLDHSVIFPPIYHLYKRGVLPLIRSYAEIGSREGFSLRHVLRELPIRELLVCDTWGEAYGGTGLGDHRHITRLLEEEGFPVENALILDGDSKVRIPEYFESNKEKIFDLGFVDGDHSPEGMLADCSNLVHHARILVVHDLRNPSHPYLREAYHLFYEMHREAFISIDDGKDLGIMIRRDIFGQDHLR